MPYLVNPPNATLTAYSASVTMEHPDSMQFVRSLYANMQSVEWEANIDSVTLAEANSGVQLSWEISETINGEAMYVAYSVIGVPASSFSFVLVVYSRQEDYTGNVSAHRNPRTAPSIRVVH